MTVVIVGSINQDIVAQVERIPAPGETVLATTLLRTGGGKGANQAVAARRAGGARVAFVGAVGTDADGESLRSALIADEIDVSGLSQIDGPSGIALIAVDAAAENTIVVVPGANAAIPALTEMQSAVVAGASVLLTQLEIPISLVQEAAAARSATAWHLLNAAPSAPFIAAGAALLAAVDVLIVNEHEALDIAEVAEVDEAIDVLASRVGALVITLGQSGSLVICRGERAHVPAFAADAIDTTGAGDTFCGMFAATLAASGRTPDTADVTLLAGAARAGAAAAALAVTRQGAQAAVPAQTEVAALLERGDV
ncbi:MULTISPECIES: PfkB family carbohydrate kinase [unclassified Microbacterium]|uniref:PfkB family carbohydrate kinase n=1 Tax=unclassified Microbacterium TaxID=2609290 RepID=UPI000EAAB6A5|nr:MULTISPECIES: PfkB family carbohydrate kinase [unclassified Microbacterium]MBT2484715.1 ribokinase [Microbacterium sp. ISL-108]RKN67599.1 ribokinase [Microbacterium sp. CGR2]